VNTRCVWAVKESLDQGRHHRVQAEIAREPTGPRAEEWKRQAREAPGSGMVEATGHDLPQDARARPKEGPDIERQTVISISEMFRKGVC
jgi:hypothetical protein